MNNERQYAMYIAEWQKVHIPIQEILKSTEAMSDEWHLFSVRLSSSL